MPRRIIIYRHGDLEDAASIRAWAAPRGAEVLELDLHKTDPPQEPAADEWLLVLGGAQRLHAPDRPAHLDAEVAAIQRCVAAGRTVVGICLGSQLMAEALGATTGPMPGPEIGWRPVSVRPEARQVPAFAHLPDGFETIHWHNDTFELPQGATLLGHSEHCPNQGFALGQRAVAMQFHLEPTRESLQRFLDAGCFTEAPGPRVQDPRDMLADPARFDRAIALLHGVFDALAAGEQD